MTYEQERLVAVMHAHLTSSDHQALRDLLDDDQGLHEITLLKREPRDFSLGEIKREIGRGEQLRPFYQLA